jgi:hypothetical protein
MGVGRTVYKGEVETGVFAWSLSLTGPLCNAIASSLNWLLHAQKNPAPCVQRRN